MSVTVTPRTRYFGESITVTTAPQNLWSLITALGGNIAGNIPQAVSCLSLQYGTKNNGAATGIVFVGGSDVSTANSGYELTKGASKTYPPTGTQSLCLADIFVVVDSGTAVLNVEGMTQ